MASHHITKPLKIHVNAIRRAGKAEVEECPDDDPYRCAFSRYRVNDDGFHDWISDHRTRADAEQGVSEIDIDSPEERRRVWRESRPLRWVNG